MRTNGGGFTAKTRSTEKNKLPLRPTKLVSSVGIGVDRQIAWFREIMKRKGKKDQQNMDFQALREKIEGKMKVNITYLSRPNTRLPQSHAGEREQW